MKLTWNEVSPFAQSRTNCYVGWSVLLTNLVARETTRCCSYYRLDQRVSNVKALLQLCKGALPREDWAGGEQKETVPMPCVWRMRTLRKQKTRIRHTGSELGTEHPSLGMRLDLWPNSPGCILSECDWVAHHRCGGKRWAISWFYRASWRKSLQLWTRPVGVGVYDFQRCKMLLWWI